jgi:hypothetical protein
MIDIDIHTSTGPSGLPYLQAQLIEFVANAWQVVPTVPDLSSPSLSMRLVADSNLFNAN